MKKERVALVIQPNGQVAVHRLHKKETLDQLQGWVKGSIEGIKGVWGTAAEFPDSGKIYQMWVNEEGLINGMEVNPHATCMARSWAKRTGHIFNGALFGPCVLVIPNLPENTFMRDKAVEGFQLGWRVV